MSSVSLSVGVRNALTSLQNTNALSQTIQNRLATGKKVNSALDNPASFFVAAGLQNRSGDLGRLLDDMGQGTKVIEAADKGITAIKKLIETAQGTLRQVLQSASTAAKVTGTVSVTSGTKPVADLGLTTTAKLDINGTSISIVTADTIDTLVDKINQNTTLNGSAAATTGSGSVIKASVQSGKLVIESADGSTDVDLSGSDAGVADALFGVGTNVTKTSSVNAARTALASQFDSLRTQIDQLQKDTGYNGINLLNGDSLKVTFNETGSSSITVEGKTFDSLGLGIKASTGNFQSDTNVNEYLTALTDAATTLRTQASTFGANLSVVQNRQDFTKGLINTLTTGADSLTMADQNEEGATLLALQTRQQLSQTAMSLSNQADQAVLRLFG